MPPLSTRFGQRPHRPLTAPPRRETVRPNASLDSCAPSVGAGGPVNAGAERERSHFDRPTTARRGWKKEPALPPLCHLPTPHLTRHTPSHSQAYESLGRIGEGTYGVVLRARHRASGELVAIKRFKEASDDSNQVRQESVVVLSRLNRGAMGVAWGRWAGASAAPPHSDMPPTYGGAFGPPPGPPAPRTGCRTLGFYVWGRETGVQGGGWGGRGRAKAKGAAQGSTDSRPAESRVR